MFPFDEMLEVSSAIQFCAYWACGHPKTVNWEKDSTDSGQLGQPSRYAKKMPGVVVVETRLKQSAPASGQAVSMLTSSLGKTVVTKVFCLLIDCFL